ncbi:MAG TPA: phosphatase [Candidatus Didemnitutus sp.]|nr:phosphatase [Candidatus Didemnitutus sp.]
MNPSVAVLDVGSNTIKILVAVRDARGGLSPLLSRAIDARISAGIGQAAPRLSDEGMAAAMAAIHQLLADAAPFGPVRMDIVATSAVRDASNGAEFAARVARETGCEMRVLSGTEEAAGIGLGLTCDPALADAANFYVFDLGGGSLECLAFENREPRQAISLPLGCVRLTEKFVSQPAEPMRAVTWKRIMAHTRTAMAESGFRFDLVDPIAVATGGSASTARALYGVREGRSGNETSSLLTVRQLQGQLEQMASLPLAERKKLPGLPPERADVYPAALATLIAVAETGGIVSYRHSYYNLRYGLATQLLKAIEVSRQ